MKRIERVCAWCKETIGYVEVADADWNNEEQISHGACPGCVQSIMLEFINIKQERKVTNATSI